MDSAVRRNSVAVRPMHASSACQSPHKVCVTGAVHDRMPVILHPENYDVWLDPGMNDVQAVSELLKPCDARLMRSYPISTRINHVVNDDEDCSRLVEIVNEQNRLFS